MQIYVGYGFDVNEIKDKDWLELMHKHDPKEYEDFVEDIKENYGVEDGPELEEILVADVEDRIAEGTTLAEYLRDIINEAEGDAAGTNYIVSSYDNFLVFDSIRFVDDSPRAKHVKSQGAFIQMIGKYIPTEDITFGNLYDGVEWADSCYYLD